MGARPGGRVLMRLSLANSQRSKPELRAARHRTLAWCGLRAPGTIG